MKEINVEFFSDLETQVAKLKRAHQHAIGGLLFRGQGDTAWPLQTTLERRSGPLFKIADYYSLIFRIRHQVESFTNSKWELPSYDDIQTLTFNFDTFSRSLRRHDGLPGYKHPVYLRHHGFPSPLLDWSSSLYVAAYFAFANRPHNAETVSVDEPENIKTWGNDRPSITRFGPHVQTHRRHFLQKAEYTICTFFESDDWLFVPHNDVFKSDMPDYLNQDVLWKFNIPASEQVSVLKQLEEYNLNAFSLFGSDESLMETLAIRELLLRDHKD